MNFRFNKKEPINATTGQLYPFKKASQRDRYTGYFTVPLAYKLIYYCNWINILRSNYKLNNSAFLLFHNPI